MIKRAGRKLLFRRCVQTPMGPVIMLLFCFWVGMGQASAVGPALARNKQQLELFFSSFPQIELAGLEEVIDQYEKVPLELENSLDLVFERKEFLHAMNLINGELATPGKFTTEEKGQISRMVLDLLLFSALVPGKKIALNRPGSGNDYLAATASPLTMNKAVRMVEELAQLMQSRDRFDWTQAPSFAHLQTPGHFQLPLAERMMLVGLANFKAPAARKELLQDKLFQGILKSKDPWAWSLGARGSDEQVYLNSCVSSVLNQDIMVHSPNVGSLLWTTGLMAKGVSSRFLKMAPAQREERAYDGLIAPPSKEEFFRETMERVERQKADLYNRSLLICSKDVHGTNRQEEIRQLSRDWSRLMQDLSSIHDPSDPVYMTSKPLKGQWAASGMLMLVPSLFGSLVPGQPSITDRHKGLEMSDLAQLSKRSLESVDSFKSAFLKNVGSLSSRVKILEATGNGELVTNFMQKLWKEVSYQGGLALNQNGSHSLFLRASNLEGRPVFLLNDPKISTYKLMDLSDFSKFLQGSEVEAAE